MAETYSRSVLRLRFQGALTASVFLFFVSGASAQNIFTPMTEASFLQMIKEVAQVHDLRDHDDVARILGFTLRQTLSGRGKELQPDPSPQWIRSFSYYVIEKAVAGDGPPRISIRVREAELCVSVDNVWTVFGRSYESHRPGPPPIFGTAEEAVSYRRRLADHGVYEMTYRFRDSPRTTVTFSFFFEKCLDAVHITIVSAPIAN